MRMFVGEEQRPKRLSKAPDKKEHAYDSGYHAHLADLTRKRAI